MALLEDVLLDDEGDDELVVVCVVLDELVVGKEVEVPVEDDVLLDVVADDELVVGMELLVVEEVVVPEAQPATWFNFGVEAATPGVSDGESWATPPLYRPVAVIMLPSAGLTLYATDVLMLTVSHGTVTPPMQGTSD